MVGVKSLIALPASGQLEHQSKELCFHVALLVDENFIDKSKLVKDINAPRYTHIPWIRLDKVKSARNVASLMDGNHCGVALEQWLAPAIKEQDLCKAQLDKQLTNKKLEENLKTLQTTVDQKGLMSCCYVSITHVNSQPEANSYTKSAEINSLSPKSCQTNPKF